MISKIWVEWKAPKDNLVRCIQIFTKFLTRNYRSKVEFPPQWKFGLNGSLCRFRFFFFFQDFLENVHRKLNFRNLRLDEKLSKNLKFLTTKHAKSKNRMEIIGTPWKSDKIRVFWDKNEENICQIFVLKIALGTHARALEKAWNLLPFRFIVSLSLPELWHHSRTLLLWTFL